ncbi:MAG: hypothetical protein RLN75_07370, partial [Longimicrobiales bacterium]
MKGGVAAVDRAATNSPINAGEETVDESPAYIRLSLTEGTFEIRGSEQFVGKQAERFESLIQDLLRRKPDALRAPMTEDAPIASATDTNDTDDANDAVTTYPKVFARKGDGFQITAKVPGSSNAEKTANIAMLLGLAFSLDAKGPVPAPVVQNAAKDHG